MKLTNIIIVIDLPYLITGEVCRDVQCGKMGRFSSAFFSPPVF